MIVDVCSNNIDSPKQNARVVRSCTFCLVGLFACLLCGYTINIYKNGEAEDSVVSKAVQALTGVENDSTGTGPENDRTGTVGAASVMAINTTPSGALVSYDDSVALEGSQCAGLCILLLPAGWWQHY